METNFERDFINSLMSDLGAEMLRAAATADQIQRRSVIRSGFATVEGFLAFIKQSILDDLDLNPGYYSEGEIAMLRELNYTVDEKGEVRVTQKFIPTEANFLFTMKAWCRGISDGKLDLGGVGWQDFKASLKVRHRLVHPKNKEDLNLTDDDLLRFIHAMTWFMKSVHEKLQEVLDGAGTESQDGTSNN